METYEGFELIGKYYVEKSNTGSKQEYSEKPERLSDVRGASSKAIYKFMTTMKEYIALEDLVYNYPNDVDDFERNRALLLCYPEWRNQLKDMSIISYRWKNIVENWDIIEKLYDNDYTKYGNKTYNHGECCTYIRNLIK